jgi:hypothetical protein
LRTTPADALVAEETVKAAPPPAVAFDALSVPPPKDAVVATAESRPWWLTAAPLRADATAGDDPIPIPLEHVPTTGERASAAVMAVWLGGSALSAVLPEPRVDDDEEELLPQTNEQDEN